MILYFIIVVIGAFIAGKLILGELQKEKGNYIEVLPVRTPDPASEPQDFRPKEIIVESPNDQPIDQLYKLEVMLKEKNAEIKKLQDLLIVEQRNKGEIDKIKSLLEWQVFESRQMNKEIKKQLAEIIDQSKHYQQEAVRLKSDLHYKEQMLNHNEIMVSELKNRLMGYLSVDENPSIIPQIQSDHKK
jgi:hypothetical protein